VNRRPLASEQADTDGECSLGWTADGVIGNTDGMDREFAGSSLTPAALAQSIASRMNFDLHQLGQRRVVARVTQAINRRSQENRHLFAWPCQSPAPPDGSAHLPTQKELLSSHRQLIPAAPAGKLMKQPAPMRVIAKKRCRVMVEPPENGAGRSKS
jgi:hypothetical protein